jgi:hypothetical protein
MDTTLVNIIDSIYIYMNTIISDPTTAINLLVFVVIIYVILGSTLSNSLEDNNNTNSSEFANFIVIILILIFVLLVLINGFKYIFDFDIVIWLNSIFLPPVAPPTTTQEVSLPTSQVEPPITTQEASPPNVEVQKEIIQLTNNENIEAYNNMSNFTIY